MKELILEQLQIFPTVTKDQLYRLVKGCRGHLLQSTFNDEFNKLIQAGSVEQVTTDTSVEYRATSYLTKAEKFAKKILEE